MSGGSGGSTRSRFRSRRTGASSRAGRCTSSRRRRVRVLAGRTEPLVGIPVGQRRRPVDRLDRQADSDSRLTSAGYPLAIRVPCRQQRRHYASRTMRRAVRALVAALLVVAVPPRQPARPPPSRQVPLVERDWAKRTSRLVRCPGVAPPPEPLVSAWLVADATTGAVLAACNPHQRLRPASTLKTLTAPTLLPRLDPAASYTAVDADALQDGSRVGMVPGTTYSIPSLFDGCCCRPAMMLPTPWPMLQGVWAHCRVLMNETPANCRRTTPSPRIRVGLDDDVQVTSVYDLALIARAGLAREDFAATSRSSACTSVASTARTASRSRTTTSCSPTTPAPSASRPATRR